MAQKKHFVGNSSGNQPMRKHEIEQKLLAYCRLDRCPGLISPLLPTDLARRTIDHLTPMMTIPQVSMAPSG